MTVSTDLNRKQYTGNGVTTSFATSPVVFFDSTDLDVYVVTTATGAATLLTETTDYTVTGGAGSTGTVSTAGLYGAPSASQTLVIVRNVPLTQEADFVQNDSSDAEVQEDALDKLTMAAQQLSARLDRSFTLADSDVSGASLTVPTPEAGQILAWNSSADALENVSASDLSAVLTTTFSESLLDDPDAATARATLDAQQDVFTTRGDLVRAGVAGVAERVAVGTNGQVLTSNGTDPAWAAPAVTQRVYSEYTTNAALTTTLPVDDTIPQSGEGTEVLTASITPKSASSRIRVRFQAFGAGNGAGYVSAALFKDAGADALTAGAFVCAASNYLLGLQLEYEESAGSTTARTYKIRVGPDGGGTTSVRLNGTTASRLFGGAARSTLILEEIN